jgi:anti-sigma B factor antagonist
MAHEELTIDVSSEIPGETAVFRLTGSLDVATSPRLKEELLNASARNQNDMIIDLTRVDFLDSTGLGALMGAHRRAAEKGGRVSLIVSDGPISRLLHITGLARVFPVYPSIGDALAAISGVQ